MPMQERRGTIPTTELLGKKEERIQDVYGALRIARGTPYRVERVLGRTGVTIGQELLYGENIQSIDTPEKSFQLLIKGILEAYSRIVAGEEGYFSVNAFIEDIQHPRFKEAIAALPLRKEDRKRIIIEIVERPAQIGGNFGINLQFLRYKGGFPIYLDDFDLDYSHSDSNASRELFRRFPLAFSGIKIPYQFRKAIMGKDPALMRRLGALQGKTIILEGGEDAKDIALIPARIDAVQLYNRV